MISYFKNKKRVESMATCNGRIEEILGKQIAECSPYFDLMKFEGVPAISSTKYNDLIAKEEFEPKKDDLEEDPNFLDYWSNEMANNHEISIKDIKEEIDAHGPVDAILRDFDSHSINADPDIGYESYNQIEFLHQYRMNDITDSRYKDFKNRGYDSEGDEACESINSHEQVYKEQVYYNQHNNALKKSDAEKITNSRPSRKIKRREAKFYRKLHTGNIHGWKIQNGSKPGVHNFNSTIVQDTKPSSASIPKFRSTFGMSSRSKQTRGKNIKTDLTGSSQIEESKVHQISNRRFKDCLSSTSTLSNEKDDKQARKYSKITEAFIQLENNLKIICREVGPLNAENRRMKVLHYFEKKRNRKWQKRINYTTRKQVADVRPRYKGRFVTIEQSQMFEEIEKHRREMKDREKVFIIVKNCKSNQIINSY